MIIAGAYTIMAFKYPIAYMNATYEDLIGEWTQVYFFLMVLLFSVRASISLPRYRFFFIVLALSCFYVAMEEISWGQRIFGWSSPDLFQKHNLQGETNLHNFVTGPFSTTIKNVMEYLLTVGLIVYGLLYPLALKLRWRPADRLDAKGLAAPPLYLWPVFITAAVLELGRFNFNEPELAELLLGFALAVMTVQYVFSQARNLDIHNSSSWAGKDSKHLMLTVLAGVLVVLGLSAATTYLVQSSPVRRAAVEQRFENGVEKFARRYVYYEQWETALYLYGKLLAVRPGDTALIREIADVYSKSGDKDKFREYCSRALAIDLKRYDKYPERASVNRSLAQTYHLMGDKNNAAVYLRNALNIGLERIAEHPDSANAAYSLGRTYELMGRFSDAFEQFSRAVELNPANKEFRAAYYRARKKI